MQVEGTADETVREDCRHICYTGHLESDTKYRCPFGSERAPRSLPSKFISHNCSSIRR